MSKWALAAIGIVILLVCGIFIGGEITSGESTPISEMTVEQLFVLVIVAALLMGR